MSNTFLKVASVTLLTSAIVLFAVIYNPNANLAFAHRLPTGTYWNWNAGFGDSELRFLKDGRYTNGAIGTASAEGNYTETKDRIVFVEFGPADAPCLHIPGMYQWSLQRRMLTLKAINDECPTRQFDWRSGVWIQQLDTSFGH